MTDPPREAPMKVTEKTFRAALPALMLCRKAGAVKTGVGAALDAVRNASGKPAAVILASDASERTKKQVGDKCSFYSVPLFETETTAEELGELLGSRSLCAAAAVMKRGPYESLIRAFELPEEDNGQNGRM